MRFKRKSKIFRARIIKNGILRKKHRKLKNDSELNKLNEIDLKKTAMYRAQKRGMAARKRQDSMKLQLCITAQLYSVLQGGTENRNLRF